MRAKTAIFLFFILLSGCIVFRPSPYRLYQKAIAEAPFDAVIVPGTPYVDKGWTWTMQHRVLWAVYLYNKGIAKNLIFSGAATYTPYVEGRVMAMYAEQLGVPEEHILIEDRAMHSTENVWYSYQLARQYGFNRIGLATDPFQSVVLMGYTRRRLPGPVMHIPFLLDSIRASENPDICIDTACLRIDNFHSIVKAEKPLKRLKGTLGWNINYKKEGGALSVRRNP